MRHVFINDDQSFVEQIDILWIFNTKIPTWENMLPADTKKLLVSQRGQAAEMGIIGRGFDPFTPADLQTFPMISTAATAFTTELVMMLSQQATWSILQLENELKTLLS